MQAEKIESSYKLSPAQQGMLFHSMAAPRSGVYLQQLRCGLREDLNVPAFVRAWERVAERHAILRTGFRWDGADGPRQEVHGAVVLPFEQHDWRSLSARARESGLENYLRADRRRAFEFGEAPLMRFALFRMAEADYQFVWTSHHALMDGRSRLTVLKEVFAFYEAFRDGRDLTLEEPRPYRDFIDWLEHRDSRRAEDFWRRLLKGFAAPTPLAASASSAHEPSRERVGEVSTRLSAGLTSALHAFAQEHGLTLNTILQGAWALLLSRYSGEADVVFGATRAGRRATVEGADTMVGVFINTLPVRAEVSPDKSLLSLLKELRAQAVALREYEHTPLLKVREWSDLPAGSPVFESILVFENYQLNSALRARGGAWRGREFELLEQSNYPLAVVGYGGEELLLKIVYQQQRFVRPTVARMLGHLETALGVIIDDPLLPVARVSLMTAAERRRVLHDWNQTQADYPRDTCVHQLFEAQAERTPDSVAIVFEGEQLSYRELDECASLLALLLRARGVGPEAVVGVCVERSVEMVLSVLAVLKAGGAYLPLDPRYPRERLSFMLDDAGARLLLTQRHLKGTLNVDGVEVITLDADTREGVQVTDDDLTQEDGAGVRVSPENLAYVIYTSGSTGRPKGVMVEHRGLCNLVAAQIKEFDITPESRVLQFASLSFDASVSEIFTTLVAGATLHMASREELMLGQSLTRLLREQDITVVTLPPSMIATLPVRELKELRTLVSAGESCTEEVAAVCSSSVPRFLNAYGPTETTVCATVSVCADASRHSHIGRPIDNTLVYLLDARLQPVPVGVPGEMYVAGVGLARGYLNRPALTAERFRPNPFGDEPGARLYKTGDLARHLDDGDIEFIGRVDQQVKVRGFRVELGEIENTLRQHEGVRESVVVAREAASGDKRLVAYLTTRRDGTLTAAGLREFLRQRLPEHMIPSAFVSLESLPLSPNGKIDRRALPPPDQLELETDSTQAAPRTPTEEIIADIWRDVLGLKRVGVEENFFELGGHSLLATQVVSRIREIFKVELPLRGALEAVTVAGLAERVEQLLRQESGRHAPPIRPAARDKESALSFAQQRLWLLNQLQPDASVYNAPLFLKLSGHLDPAALRDALSEVVRRHEVLRTTFEKRGDLPVQLIHEHTSPPLLPVTDLSALPEAERWREVETLARQEASRAFDLSVGPLIRARLFRTADDEHALLLTLHHIVSDGWSMEVLLDELSSFYSARLRRETSSAPAPTVQYADFALWQRGWLSGEVLSEELDYWRAQMDGAPAVLELPTDYTRPAVQSYRGASYDFTLPAELAAGLRELSRRSGATLFMTLLAAFKILLSRYTGREDIVVGTPIAGRNRAETERLIGLFVNTLVLRTRVSAEEEFASLLARVREVCLEAYAHQEIPFEKLVEELRPERSLGHAPLFQVMFSLLNTREAESRMDGLEVTRVALGGTNAKFDLTLTLAERDDGAIRGSLRYSTDLFRAETVERMGRHWRRLLEGIAEEPRRRVHELPLLSDEERARQLVEWNRTATQEDEQPRTVHQLFEAQAARRAIQTAVVFEGEQISYGELNGRASRLARMLRRRGVGPDSRVGLLLDRSPEAVVALLAVLKAGGAYLPLDPRYPRERLSFMLDDAGARLLLTQPHLKGTLNVDGVEVITLDADTREGVQVTDDDLTQEDGAGVRVSPENLAYVIYTSGSTGKPKGVMVEHRQLFNYVRGVSRRMEFEAGAHFAMVSTFAADLGHTMLFPSLCGGGTLHLISSLRAMDAAALGDYFRRRRIDYLKIVPSHLRAMLAASHERAHVVPRRRLILGGEAAGRELVAEVEKLNPECLVTNHYGPTETTVGVLTHTVEPGSERARESPTQTIPLGRPLPGSEVYVLDDRLQPVPVGVAGELYIGGGGLARGYFNSPGLTAARFIPHPFSAAPGERLYRTGDLARHFADGKVEFLGRRDQQVKIRAFRVELGEVESVLAAHEEVREAAVVAREDKAGEKRLVAYVVAREGASLDADMLRRHARGQLPGYMIPSAFVMLERLPRMAHGKLDRAALPSPESFEKHDGKDSARPRTSTEEVIAKIFSEALGLEGVGVEENFFELGGHSLLATQVVSRIREMLMVELPLRDLFESPTVLQLSEAITAREPQPGQTETIARLLIRIQRETADDAR